MELNRLLGNRGIPVFLGLDEPNTLEPSGSNKIVGPDLVDGKVLRFVSGPPKSLELCGVGSISKGPCRTSRLMFTEFNHFSNQFVQMGLLDGGKVEHSRANRLFEHRSLEEPQKTVRGLAKGAVRVLVTHGRPDRVRQPEERLDIKDDIGRGSSVRKRGIRGRRG